MILPDCITIEEPVPDYPVYVVRHPAASARVALHGAHIMEWAPAGQDPVLYLSPQAVIHSGKPIRGGIPICWPWFGAPPDDASKPMHGLARLRFWHLVEVQATAAAVNFEFSLTNDAEMRTQWPYDFSLQASLHIGRALDLCLKTTNTGSRAFPITEALHTYLRVGDIRQVTVRGLDGESYRDTVGPVATRQQEGDIVIDREVDRQYASRGPVVVEDGALKRHIHIANEGSNTVVVWNPWIEKSTRLADLPNNDYPRFLCIEAANVDPAIMIDPGQTHEIRTQISLG